MSYSIPEIPAHLMAKVNQLGPIQPNNRPPLHPVNESTFNKFITSHEASLEREDYPHDRDRPMTVWKNTDGHIVARKIRYVDKERGVHYHIANVPPGTIVTE